MRAVLPLVPFTKGYNTMMLSGATALITGGAVRVGRAIVEGLAAEGMRVVIHYNGSEPEARALVESLNRDGREAVCISADLSTMDGVEALAASALAAFGAVDVLVNNASLFHADSLDETSPEIWERTIAVNLRAPFFLTQRLASSLRERRGVVVNITDLAGLQSWEDYAAHGIAKAGLAHLTRVAARALAPEARVVGIAPGTVLPPDSLADEEVAALAERAPLKRNGSPDDVVQALLYLLRADFVTGETIVVDGGRLLRS